MATVLQMDIDLFLSFQPLQTQLGPESKNQGPIPGRPWFAQTSKSAHPSCPLHTAEQKALASWPLEKGLNEEEGSVERRVDAP